MPPSRLPQSIVSLELYRRTFSDRNFEVVRTSSGAFKTTQRVSGRFYELCLQESPIRLFVREVDDSEKPSTLELLDGTASGILMWAADLPVRLREMHSHWLCRDRNIILLRPRKYDQRRVYFVLARKESSQVRNESPAGEVSATEWVCYQIPQHFQQFDWIDLPRSLTTLNRLMLCLDRGSTRALAVLRKFETDEEYIHVLEQARGRILFDLPRFGLSFEHQDQGTLLSTGFVSFSLRERQQFNDTLHDFSQYLVLFSAQRERILVPSGSVAADQESIFIQGQSCFDAHRKFHVYDIHPRFRTLNALTGSNAVEARLQLAALYTATGSTVPEARTLRTGGEVAIELLRQSWVNRPLTNTEDGHLNTICTFAKFHPALPLLSHELRTSASELAFLHRRERVQVPSPDVDALSEYVQRKKNNTLNPNELLSNDEEEWLLGYTVPQRLSTSEENKFIHIGKINSFEREKKTFQYTLCEMTRRAPPEQYNRNDFPFHQSCLNRTQIGKETIEQLEASWMRRKAQPGATLIPCLSEVSMKLNSALRSCSYARTQLESDLLNAIENIPGAAWQARRFNIRRSMNREGHSIIQDFVRTTTDPGYILRFNPFLSDESRMALMRGIFEWMELCVYEDKLRRMVALANNGMLSELTREAREVTREWSVMAYPMWLAYEVEQQLQIRHMQYVVAHFCMEHPRTITQLNMGEGKTRVILPILVMALSRKEHIMRLHFLSPLLSEAYDFFHNALTASLVPRKVFLLPFHRDVKLGVNDTLKMLRSLLRCQNNCGVLFVAPEHRLSLQLKWHELGLSAKVSAESHQHVLGKIEGLQYFDLLDEGDELLSINYQLIYAVGSCSPLPAGKERWVAAQALLAELQMNESVAGILKKVDAHIQRNKGQAGSFDDIRLLPGPKLEEHRRDLLESLANAVFANPPYHFRWLRGFPYRGVLVSFVTEKERNLQWLQQEVGSETLSDGQKQVFLALRGLLAYGLLEHCLSQRYRVDYGIDSRRGKNRRVAVPYRASDLPSDRSEYAQPDTLIVFTQLAYYHRGISKLELKEALKVLLQLGPVAQKVEYEEWFTSARKTMTDTQVQALDMVEKLDLSSESQLNLVQQVYQYNMAAINFWLENCVLPRETMQFPQRLSANAFHLAQSSNGNIVGFSGTKDKHLLLPIQVRQKIPGCTQVQATDGKMLDLVLKNSVVQLGSGCSLSAAVLDLTVNCKADALIDAGASMAELSNLQVAKRLVELLSQGGRGRKKQGVVFYDQRYEAWTVLGMDGHHLPLGSSPVHERNAIVYFDESHCRGADMKLGHCALGILTLGPLMAKDKLMQAAGRMRKLDQGQSLIFAIPPELVDRIRATPRSSLTTRDMMRWVLENTVDSVGKGLLLWGAQGSYYCTTNDHRARLVDEVLDVEKLYSADTSEDSIYNIAKRWLRSDMKRTEDRRIELDPHAANLLRRISAHLSRYGSDQFTIGTGVDEECEREIEYEREIETERETLIPRQAPQVSREWDFCQLLRTSSPEELTSGAGAMTLAEAMQTRLPNTNLKGIRWERCSVWVTWNYLETVQTEEGASIGYLSYFMRPVDALVVFKAGGECLLLSEWDGDHILSILWELDERQRFELPFCFVNFAFLIEARDPDSYWTWKLCIPNCSRGSSSAGRVALAQGRSAASISEHTLAGLQLFAGCTMYETAARKKALSEILQSRDAKASALRLIAMRGSEHLLSRSDLEQLCSVENWREDL